MSARQLRTTAAAIGLLLLLRPAAAQEATVPPQATRTVENSVAEQSAQPRSAVEQVGPDVIHLWDKHKKLVAVPGFTYEDFIKYYRLKQGLERTEIKSRYNVERLVINGAAQGDYADLQVDLRVVVHDSQWNKIPLRLGELSLRKPAGYVGEGEHSLEFDEGTSGYVLWLRAEPGTVHSLKFDAVAQLSTSSGNTRIELTAPRATSSEMNLAVPPSKVEVTSQGIGVPTVSNRDDGQSLISTLGLAGRISVGWRDASISASKTPVLLSANTKILARLDGRITRSEATITVRSFGGSFRKFSVKLPPGAQLVASEQPGNSVTPSSVAGLVDVQLANASSGPVDVRLVTDQSYDVTQADQFIELAGFEVVDAVRQWGQIVIAVVGDWKLVWGPRDRARQIDQWSETLQASDAVAAFELSGKNCSLQVRAVPRIATTHVEPEYICLIDPGQVRLEAKLKYQIRGGKIFSLPIDIQDWQIEDVGPASAVTRNWSIDGTTLTLPLAQATTGELEITLRARRPITGPGDLLLLSMPRPRADVVSQANLIIGPADNVVLEPLPEQMAGLTRRTGVPPTSLTDRQQVPIAYWSEAAEATFAANYRILQQQVNVRVRSDVTVEQERAVVAQRMAFNVAHESLQNIELRLPQEVVGSNLLEVKLDGQAITPETSRTDVTEPGEIVRLQIALAKPRIGTFELTVGYSVSLADLVPESTATATIPLAMPAQATVLSNEVAVRSSDGIDVENRASDVWKLQPNSAVTSNSVAPSLQLVSSAASSEISLLVRLEPKDRSTVIEKALVQTWISASLRQDRALYRLLTSARTLRIQMPRGVDPTTIEVFVNRSLVTPGPKIDAKNVLTLDLPNVSSNEQLLELRYFFPQRTDAQGRLDIELPAFEGVLWVQRMYWQLVLPRGEHLVQGPSGMTPEFQWKWLGTHWGRIAALNDNELSKWIQIDETQHAPDANNVYLFSAMGDQSHLELWTISRSLVVFIASFGVLVIGLMLIYVPFSRHPVSLLLLTIALLAISFLYPGPVLLVLQAAGLGLLLAVIAVLIRRSGKRRRPVGQVIRSGPSSVLDHASTEFYQRGKLTGPASTATVPVMMDISAVEAKP